MRYTFVVYTFNMQRYVFFSKRAYILTSFLYHNRGGKNDVKFDVKSLVV